MFNRDITGRVNPNGQTMGKTVAQVTGAAIPVVTGGIVKPVSPQTLKSLDALPEIKAMTPLGGRAVGKFSRREYDLDKIGMPIRNLTTDNIKITHRGVDFVEKHLSRFDKSAANEVMVQRLRKIANGKMPATQQDLNFYAHELRESIRYKRLGFPTGQPINADDARELWNNTHTPTLEEYRIKENNSLTNDPLYHPDAAKRFFEDYK